eukprot:3338236-Pleurochrysis_carterae.AAC.1
METAAAVERHRNDLLSDPDRIADVRSELAGKRLGCWCSEPPCHCRTLAAVANCTTSELGRITVVRNELSPEAAQKLASFQFPLRSLDDVLRLLA